MGVQPVFALGSQRKFLYVNSGQLAHQFDVDLAVRVRWERRARTEPECCTARVVLVNSIVSAHRGWTATAAGG